MFVQVRLRLTAIFLHHPSLPALLQVLTFLLQILISIEHQLPHFTIFNRNSTSVSRETCKTSCMMSMLCPCVFASSNTPYSTRKNRISHRIEVHAGCLTKIIPTKSCPWVGCLGSGDKACNSWCHVVYFRSPILGYRLISVLSATTIFAFTFCFMFSSGSSWWLQASKCNVWWKLRRSCC